MNIKEIEESAELLNAIADLDSIELEHVDTIEDEEGTMPVFVLV